MAQGRGFLENMLTTRGDVQYNKKSDGWCSMKEERIRFCGLKEREVINICDCKRLGFVADLQINICSGCVEALIVPGPGRICGILGYDAEYIIPFECIRRIGEDIILVEIKEDKCLKPCK